MMPQQATNAHPNMAMMNASPAGESPPQMLQFAQRQPLMSPQPPVATAVTSAASLQQPPLDKFVLEVYAGINFLLDHWIGRLPRRRLVEFGGSK